MGQVVPFPTRPIAPAAKASDLPTAECVLLLAIRWWVEDYCAGADPMPRLREALDKAGAHDAAFSIDGLMTSLAHVTRRRLSIHCPRCPDLSNDERRLLEAASLTQSGRIDLAQQALRTALLSSDGAACAIDALDGLCEIFGQTRLFFARRPEPSQDGVEAWSPPQTLP
jgi:hypothetical protein